MLAPLFARRGKLLTALDPNLSRSVVAGRNDVEPKGSILHEPHVAEARLQIVVAVAQVFAAAVDAREIPEVTRGVGRDFRSLLAVVEATVSVGDLIRSL